MQGLKELRETNDRAAARELEAMRMDTIRYLRYTMEQGGIEAVHALFNEALPPLRRALVAAQGRKVA